MITGVHALVYADDAEAARAFFRDVLEFPYVDAHGGWLRFGTGPSGNGCTPRRVVQAARVRVVRARVGTPGRITRSLTCDDITATVAGLEARGAEFTQEIKAQGLA